MILRANLLELLSGSDEENLKHLYKGINFIIQKTYSEKILGLLRKFVNKIERHFGDR